MMRLISLLLVATLVVWGQSTPCRPSARAIFLGEKGAITPAPGCESSVDEAAGKASAKETASPRPPAGSKKATPPNQKGQPQQHPTGIVPVASVLGTPMSAMMYWIELVKPSGEMQRVTSDRVFRSGERIRLHFQSNVTGRVMIAQIRPDGSSQVLFPDSRVNAGDNLIQAKVETAIPPSGHFRFDNETGTDRLMVFLHPGASPPGDGQTKAGTVLGADETMELTRNILSAKRGLILETDARAGEQFVAAPGSVAIEIQLRHR